MVTINISNRGVYTLIAILILITVGGIVFAYTTDGSGIPNIMGHSADEIQGGTGEIEQTVIELNPASNEAIVSCEEGWIRTGCSSGRPDISNADAIPEGENSCKKVSHGSAKTDALYIHCIRIKP